jgi:hypothetical protein
MRISTIYLFNNGREIEPTPSKDSDYEPFLHFDTKPTLQVDDHRDD